MTDSTYLSGADIPKPDDECEEFFRCWVEEGPSTPCLNRDSDGKRDDENDNGKTKQETNGSGGNGKQKHQTRESCGNDKLKRPATGSNVNGKRKRMIESDYEQQKRTRHTYRVSDHRKLIWHKNTPAVLAINDRGFTISNGIQSRTFDGVYDWHSVVDSVLKMNVFYLYLADARTEEKWYELKKTHSDDIEDIKEKRLEPDESGIVCCYCNKPQCHRWKAVRGYAKLFQMKVQPIPHSAYR